MTLANIPPPAKSQRPLSVTWLALGVLSIAGFNSVRLVLALRTWMFIASLESVTPLYLALTGLVWTALGLPLAWGLWRGRRWAIHMMQYSAPVYAVYIWLERLLLYSRNDGNPTPFVNSPSLVNWPFTAVLTFVLLVLIFWILSTRKSRRFFGDVYE